MKFIVDLFVDCTLRCPDQVALVLEDGRSLTYAQLDARVDYIAKLLVRFVREGATKEEREVTQKVAIMMTRDVSFVASVLAILKVNAAYVPIDPSFPVHRQSYIFAHSQCALLLTDVASYEHVKQLGVELPLTLVLSAEQGIFEDSSDPNIADSLRDQGAAIFSTLPQRNNGAERLAYVIYTSGSTGKPKGVMVTQVGVANIVNWFAEQLNIGMKSRIMGLTTFSFDISVLEMFLPLTRGGAFVLAKSLTQKDPFRIIELIQAHGINVFQATPTTYEMMLATGWKGDDSIDFLVGGEAFRPTLLALAAASKSLRNVYGPTETTIWSTSYTVPLGFAAIADTKSLVMPIGSAISETDLYLVQEKKAADGSWQLVTNDDDEGELWIGGSGVSVGYLHALELTREKFLDNPFRSGGRVYRTGDVARRIGSGPDKGMYIFVRRIDDQVKLDGFRIELQEVEAVFAADSLLEQAVAAVIGNKLVLYAKASPLSSPSCRLDVWQEQQLLDRAGKFLTHYMLPKQVVYVSEFPKTPNGKLDKKKLLELPLEPPVTVDRIGGDDPMRYRYGNEQPTLLSHIMDIIAQTSGRRPMLNSSFAAFGVDSLGAVIFIRSLSVSLDGFKITPAMVFAPGLTILQFAQSLEADMLSSANGAETFFRNNFVRIFLLGDKLRNAMGESFLEEGASSDAEVDALNHMSPMEMNFDEVIASNRKLLEGARGFLCFMVLWDHYYSEYKGKGKSSEPQMQMGADVAMFIVLSGFTVSLQLRQAPRYFRDIAGTLRLEKRSPWHWGRFLVSRAVGIFPIVYCGMLLNAPRWYLQDHSSNPQFQMSNQGLQPSQSAMCTVLHMAQLNSFASPQCSRRGPKHLLYASIIWCVFILYAFFRTAAVFFQDRLLALKAPSFSLPNGDDAGGGPAGVLFPSWNTGKTLRERLGNMMAVLIFSKTRTYSEAAALTLLGCAVVAVMWVVVMYHAWAKNAIVYLPYFWGGVIGASIVEAWHCALWHSGAGASPKGIELVENVVTLIEPSTLRSKVTAAAHTFFQSLFFRGESALVEVSLYPTAPACAKLVWRHFPDLIAALAGMGCTIVFTWSDCPSTFGGDAIKDTSKCVSRMFWAWWGLTALCLLFLVVSMLQRGGDRRNLSRYACESTPLTVLGYISYSCYLFQRILLEWYLPYFYYALKRNHGSPYLRFGVTEGDASVLFLLPWQWRLLVFLVMLLGCYLVQWLVQDTLVLFLYAKFLTWRRVVATRKRAAVRGVEK